MTERGRVVLIFGAVAAVVGGGLYYFFGIHQPKQTRRAAQEQIAAWETRWTAARGCLLGSRPGSSDAGEALAIRELSPDPWSRGTCTKLISGLVRGDQEASGLAEVEEAWYALDRAASGVAVAFASHVDPGGDAPKNRKGDPLPGALGALETAHAALRKAAGMGPPPVAAPAALPKAEVISLVSNGQRVTSLDAWTMPSASGLIAFGTAKAGEVQITLAPGAAPVVAAVGSGVLRTVPDAAWGAGGQLGGIAIGALDARGEPPREAPIKVAGQGRVFGVAGTAESGVVVAGGSQQLVVVRSTAGKLTADAPIEIEQLAFALDPAGRVLLAYNDANGAMHGEILRDGSPGKRIALGDGLASAACLTAKTAWVGGNDQFVSFSAEAAPVPHVLREHELLGCTAEAALLHQRGAAHYLVCGETCRVAQLEGMRPSSVGAVAGDRVVGIAARGPVIGVWREKQPPYYFATPGELTPILATSNGKVIDVVATGADGVVVARVPVQ